MSTFLNQRLGCSISTALRYETFFIGLTLFCVPCFAYIADKISPQKMFRMACFAYVLLVFPCYYLLYHYQNPLLLLPLVMVYSMEQSCVPALLMRFFPASIRYTGVSITYNTCMALVGGVSPLLGQLFIGSWNMPYGIGGLLLIGAAIALCVVKKENTVNDELPQPLALR